MNVRLRDSFKRVIGVALLARSKAKEIRNLFCSPEGTNHHAENQHSPIKKQQQQEEKSNLTPLTLAQGQVSQAGSCRTSALLTGEGFRYVTHI